MLFGISQEGIGVFGVAAYEDERYIGWEVVQGFEGQEGVLAGFDGTDGEDVRGRDLSTTLEMTMGGRLEMTMGGR